MTADLLWVFGVLLTIFGGVSAHLYRLISTMQDRMEESSQKGLDAIWAKINTLQHDLDVDRRATAENRVMIASTMVTRTDLREESDRLIQRVEQRFSRWSGDNKS